MLKLPRKLHREWRFAAHMRLIVTGHEPNFDPNFFWKFTHDMQLSFSDQSSAEGAYEKIRALMQKWPNDANRVIAKLVSLIQLKNSGYPMAMIFAQYYTG